MTHPSCQLLLHEARIFQQTPRIWLCQAAGGAPCKGVGESEAKPGGVSSLRAYLLWLSALVTKRDVMSTIWIMRL